MQGPQGDSENSKEAGVALVKRSEESCRRGYQGPNSDGALQLMEALVELWENFSLFSE